MCWGDPRKVAGMNTIGTGMNGYPINQFARGRSIDERYAPRLALMLECMLLNPDKCWDEAAALCDAYRTEWDKLNPSPSPLGKD